MTNKFARHAVQEFINNGKSPEYSKSFRSADYPNEIFTITISRKKITPINESLSLESSFISALPSGSYCEFCQGSGRAR